MELRNIPQTGKEELINIVQKTTVILCFTVNPKEIKDVYKINTKASVKPIITEFTTVSMRDKFLMSIRKYNKEHQTDKFNTTCLGITGQAQPVYLRLQRT